MIQTLMAPQLANEEETSGITLAGPGSQPVTDIEAFFASLPKFTDEEVKSLEEAIAEDRAERRVATGAGH